MLGRFFGRDDQHCPNVFHRPPAKPTPRAGRSPSNTFKMTVGYVYLWNGSFPLTVSYMTIPRA